MARAYGRASSLDVRELLADQPVPEPHDVDAPYMPGVRAAPLVAPPDDGTVGAHERLLGGEGRCRRRAEELVPDGTDGFTPLVPLPVGGGAGGLEHHVIGDQCHERFEIRRAEGASEAS